jgi:hypothetical protein
VGVALGHPMFYISPEDEVANPCRKSTVERKRLWLSGCGGICLKNFGSWTTHARASAHRPNGRTLRGDSDLFGFGVINHALEIDNYRRLIPYCPRVMARW